MADNVGKSVMSFALIAFTLLGILFGMNIMTFLFGNLGDSTISILDDKTVTITNETGAWVNDTFFTVSVRTGDSRFNGAFSVVSAFNASNSSTDVAYVPVLIPAGNYTVFPTNGSFVRNANSAAYNWTNVNVTYNYAQKTSARISSEQVNNNSLNAINTYSKQADTQFSTVSIAITLIILLAVFAFFWRFFVTSQGRSGKGNAGDFS